MTRSSVSHCLAGDIGGTKTWLALSSTTCDGRETLFERRYASIEFRTFDALLEDFLAAAPRVRIAAACFGVAGPVLDHEVKVTNLPWLLSIDTLARRLEAPVELINDFAAAAWGVDALAEEEVATVQQGSVVAGAPRLVIGAGTGLGISFSVKSGQDFQAIPTEAGRNAFAPTTPEQVELWHYLYRHHARATFELLLSGKGLLRLYDFLRLQRQAPEESAGAIYNAPDPAAEIVQRGMDGSSALCSETIDWFLQIYAARAGDLALTVLARGGVYVAGGIAPKVLSRLLAGGFLAAFCDKGIHTKFMHSLPVRVVLSERVGLLGAMIVARRLTVGAGVRAGAVSAL